MAQLALDYSMARPGGAALAAAGVVAVGRYLGTDDRCITAAEYDDLKANHIGLWVVFESQTANLSTSMLNGFAKGVSDAQRALAAIAATGLPSDSPVFWAADFDIGPTGAVQSRIAPSEAYVDGWNTVVPQGRRGGYGGLWFLSYLRTKGKVDILWECGSTSFRHGIAPASVPLDIQQTVQTPPVPGTDHNYLFTTAALVGGSSNGTDDAQMISQDAQNYFNALAADIKSAIRREGRGRLYYCAAPPAGLPQFVCIFWDRDPKDGDNILYATDGETQADHWNTLYSQTADSVAQAKAAALGTSQYQTIINLALGKDSAFTNNVSL